MNTSVLHHSSQIKYITNIYLKGCSFIWTSCPVQINMWEMQNLQTAVVTLLVPSVAHIQIMHSRQQLSPHNPSMPPPHMYSGHAADLWQVAHRDLSSAAALRPKLWRLVMGLWGGVGWGGGGGVEGGWGVKDVFWCDVVCACCSVPDWVVTVCWVSDVNNLHGLWTDAGCGGGCGYWEVLSWTGWV